MPNGAPARKVTWAQRVGAFGHLVWTSTKVGTTLVAVTAMLGLAGVGTYYGGEELGWWRPRPVPVQPVPVVDPPRPVPVVPDPIKVQIHGPSPAMIIQGVSTVFTAETSGPTGAPQWQLVPQSNGSLRVSGDGRRVDVIAQAEGRFALIVAVAGDGRQIATDQAEVEAMAQVVQPDVPPPAPAPQPQPAPAPTPQPPRTVAGEIAATLAQIESPNRAKEARDVASVINMLAGRINAGLLAPTVDVANLIEDDARRALGDAGPSWDPMFGAISIVIDTLRSQGQITTARSAVPAMMEISATLQRAQ